MMLTTKTRYAVMAIIEVAAQHNKKPIRLADIANNQVIPLHYLEQIFLKLKKCDIVKSFKGPGGGYCLNIPAKQISVDKIIDAVEENLKMTRCSQGKKCSLDGVKCKTHNLWQGLSTHIRSYFANISVADIINGQINNGNL